MGAAALGAARDASSYLRENGMNPRCPGVGFIEAGIALENESHLRYAAGVFYNALLKVAPFGGLRGLSHGGNEMRQAAFIYNHIEILFQDQNSRAIASLPDYFQSYMRVADGGAPEPIMIETLANSNGEFCQMLGSRHAN